MSQLDSPLLSLQEMIGNPDNGMVAQIRERHGGRIGLLTLLGGGAVQALQLGQQINPGPVICVERIWRRHKSLVWKFSIE